MVSAGSTLPFLDRFNIVIDGAQISKNSAGLDGGGAFIQAPGTLSVTDSVFSDNVGGLLGAAAQARGFPPKGSEPP